MKFEFDRITCRQNMAQCGKNLAQASKQAMVAQASGEN